MGYVPHLTLSRSAENANDPGHRNTHGGTHQRAEPSLQLAKTPFLKVIDMGGVSRNTAGTMIALFNSIYGHNWSKQQLCNHWDQCVETKKVSPRNNGPEELR